MSSTDKPSISKREKAVALIATFIPPRPGAAWRASKINSSINHRPSNEKKEREKEKERKKKEVKFPHFNDE